MINVESWWMHFAESGCNLKVLPKHLYGQTEKTWIGQSNKQPHCNLDQVSAQYISHYNVE